MICWYPVGIAMHSRHRIQFLVIFCMSCRWCKMYSGHAHLCVCVCVCVSVWLSVSACPDYCTYSDITWMNGRGCPVVVHCWADLQSVHGLCCYDNIAANAKCQRVLCSRSVPDLICVYTNVDEVCRWVSMLSVFGSCWSLSVSLCLRQLFASAFCCLSQCAATSNSSSRLIVIILGVL